jgi:uncharacterized damage-inducible protein DinB
MSTSVPAAIEPVALIFKLNNGMVTRALDGVSDAELWERPASGNPLGWLLGHITHTRGQLLNLLDAPWESGLGTHFKRGSALADAAAYPSRPIIETAWKETHGRMRDAFAALTEARLSAPAQGPQLPGAKTLSDQIGFLAFHEAYHVGQMSYVRRLLGHSAVAG